MATELLPLDTSAFNWKPSSPSLASRGLCSRCGSLRQAANMLVTDGHARWAVCRLHSRLWQLNQQSNLLRDKIRHPELEYTFEELRLA